MLQRCSFSKEMPVDDGAAYGIPKTGLNKCRRLIPERIQIRENVISVR
jgi:hypothetical protein